MAIKRGFAAILAVFLLAGCSTFDKMFTDNPLPPLKGERISVLQLQKELAPDPALQQTPVTLPPVWTNQFWPQAGGYPNHAMGHLSLGPKLKKIWNTSIGSGGDRRDPLIAQPVVAEGLVYTLDTDSDVMAFDLATGKQKWHVSVAPPDESSDNIGGGLAYAAGKLYVTDGYGQLLCLDPLNGKMIWKAAVPSPVRAAPTVLEDRVFLITLDNHLLVYSAADGTLSWSYTGESETTNLLGSASPAADMAAVVLPLSSGEILGLRVENGKPVWEDNLSAVRRAGTLSSIADIRGLPVIDQGLVYAASYSGRMVAIDEVSGQRVWQKEIGSAETPWAAGANVFIISSDQQLLALTRQSGDIHWVTQLPRYDESDKQIPIVWTGPLLAGGRLIVVSDRGQMAEVDPLDGKILRQTKLEGNVSIAPLVVDNTLIVLTDDGELTAYR